MKAVSAMKETRDGVRRLGAGAGLSLVASTHASTTATAQVLHSCPRRVMQTGRSEHNSDSTPELVGEGGKKPLALPQGCAEAEVTRNWAARHARLCT